MVATRTADRPHGSGSCDALQRAAERRPTGTENRRQSQGSGGASYARRPTGTEGSSILVEPGPQRSDRSQRLFLGDTHQTLGLPVLAGASGEVVDAASLPFLTRAALEEKRKDEVENKSKRRQGGAEGKFEEKMLEVKRRVCDGWRRIAPGSSLSSSGKRRKRRKRRRRTRYRSGFLVSCSS